MKTYLKYGGGIAVVGFAVMVVCYVLGLWSAERLGTGMIVGIAAALTIRIFGTVLGTREVRAPTAATGFTFGRAFKTGFMITLVSAVAYLPAGAIFFTAINPDYAEATATWTKSFMERMGAPESKIEQAEKDIREKSTLTRQLVNGVMVAVISGCLVSLVTAAVMKREPADEVSLAPPVVQ